MKKPKIGLTCCQLWMPNGVKRTYLNHDYVKAIENAGGVPYILPLVQDTAIIRQMASEMDGFLFTGGEDVNPLHYGEEPDPKLGEIDEGRDQFELALFREVFKNQKPILGVCRGLQLIAVALNGTLWQDLERYSTDHLKHRQETDHRHVATHWIDVKKGSVLEKIIGLKAKVNSYHHQAVKEIASGGEVIATSSDGMIEAVDWSTPSQYCLGVQWHPENMTPFHPQMLDLFKSLIQASQQKNKTET